MLHCCLLHGCVIICIDIYIQSCNYHYATDCNTKLNGCLIKFIKNTNNFGLSTQVLLFGNVLPTGATPIKRCLPYLQFAIEMIISLMTLVL